MPLLLAQRLPWQFNSPLNAGAWAALALVPVGILLLYFLKLRRRAIQVPSTILWSRSLEDLRVNSLFQRLRKNLLLFLQLLFVGLLLLALAGPVIQGLARQGRRLVLAIDESASMGATDVDPGPTRLDEAKREARKVIDAMGPGDLAMLVAFGSNARVVANYTGDKGLLQRRLADLRPTHSATSLREALQLVAGLANPQKYMEPGEGVVASEIVAPRLFLFTDGGFADVPGFSLGNIQPEVVVVGPPPRPPSALAPNPEPDSDPDADPAGLTRTDDEPVMAAPVLVPSDNVAILALSAARADETPEQVQLFGRVRNFREEPVACRAALFSREPSRPGDPDTLIDAVALELPARSDQSFQFDLRSATAETQYMVRLDIEDSLPLDNTAYLVIGSPRKARVLLVARDNRFLADTLETDTTRQLADVTDITAEELSSPEVARDLESGAYDLAIFDGVDPPPSPQANTLCFGVLPPGVAPDRARLIEGPVILDWDSSDPLLQYIRDFAGVTVRRALVLDPPAGARVLVEGDQGPLAFAASRDGFVDVCVGFTLVDGREFNTNWPLRAGFPLFIYNSLRVLGAAREAGGIESYAPGASVSLPPTTPGEQVKVTDLAGKPVESVARSPQGSFVITQARDTGIYDARWGDAPDATSSFAVNLFDPRESDLSTRGKLPPGVPDEQADQYLIKIGYNPVAATEVDAPALLEGWWPLTLIALGIVLVEWFLYNRRVAL